MSRTQNLLLITCLALVAVMGTYTYLTKQNNSDIWFSSGQVSQGQILYLDHCAACHGTQAQGAENWTQLDSDGNRPAPPLDGSGHAWHHSLADLTQTVVQGRGTMPAWKGTLTEEEIMAILASVQSRWPTKIYSAWSKKNP